MMDIFKPEYKSQKLKNNIYFIKYKESILKKYGKNARIYYCKIDNIYFAYKTLRFPDYEAYCPLCKSLICYFCSTIDWHKNCCLGKRIHYLFNVDSQVFIGPCLDSQYNNNPKFIDNLIYALVPYLNSIIFFGGLHISIYKLKTNIENGLHYKKADNYYDFENYLKGDDSHWDSFGIVVILDMLSVIILSIPFLFLDIFFTILIVLISIPFKFYPLKYIFGIGFYEMYGLMWLWK